MAELGMLVGVNTGVELLKAVTERVCQANPNMRVHWGLDLDTVDGKEVQQRYPNYWKWMEVYKKLNKKLNSTGMFDNPCTKRLSISAKTKTSV